MNMVDTAFTDPATALRIKLLTPVFIMLVGLPGSGKSYFREKYGKRCRILSSDDIIEGAARALGKTYSEVFEEMAPAATQGLRRSFKVATKFGDWIMWDQTNLSPKKRRGLLKELPPGYEKIAIYFEIDEELRQQRLANRPGKVIPPHVDERMRQSYVRPCVEEGFDHVYSAERFA